MRAWFVLIVIVLVLFSVRSAVSRRRDVEVIKSSPRGSPQEFIFKITNLILTIRISTHCQPMFTKDVYFDKDSFLLNPGKSAIVHMNVSLACDQFGSYDFVPFQE